MTVSNINGMALQGTNSQASPVGLGQATDAYSKNLQKQIADAQKKLQEIASNQQLSPEDKMKKKQEISQEISNLNNQLRQHQMELRRQAMQKKNDAAENEQGAAKQEQKKAGKTDAGMPGASMQTLLSADSAMKQAQAQGNAKAQLEGRANVMKVEIALDRNTGGDTSAKEAQLAEVEDRAASAGNAQTKTLSDINKNLEEASRENEANYKKNTAEKDHKADVTDKEENDVMEEFRGAEKDEEAAGIHTAESGLRWAEKYAPVDVRI